MTPIARQASAFRRGKESTKTVRASLGATTGEVVKVLETVTQRAAERIERGLSINMNHADYYTEIGQPKDQHD